MSRSELTSAGDQLRAAADAAGDDVDTDRLREFAGQLETLAERDTGPDHGRLARIQTGLSDVQSDASDDVAATIQDARDDIRSVRETLEGV